MPALRSPCSGSVAVPVKTMASPGLKTASAAGAVMVTVGAPLTVIVTVVLSDLPPASVTVAVMVCDPDCERADAEAGAGAEGAVEARGPRDGGAQVPCSGSVAVPVKVTCRPG